MPTAKRRFGSHTATIATDKARVKDCHTAKEKDSEREGRQKILHSTKKRPRDMKDRLDRRARCDTQKAT